MTRSISPVNRAIQDVVETVLADAYPEALTATEIATRTGCRKPQWQECGLRRGFRCRAQDETRRELFRPEHHPNGWDSWSYPINGQDINVMLNRLARDGLVNKVSDPGLRACLWSWRRDPATDDVLADLETAWTAS